MSKIYNVTTKRHDTGRWWSFGAIWESKKEGGAPSLSISKSQELKDFLNTEFKNENQKYITFQLYEEKENSYKKPDKEQSTEEQIDDEMLF